MRLLTALIVLAAITTAVSGQQRPQFQSSLDIVEVYVTVREGDDAPLRGLERNDFDLRVDGKPRDIAVFSREIQPVSIAMILDMSGSITGGDKTRIKQAAQTFVGYLLDRDRMSIETLYWRCQALTGDKMALVNSVGSVPTFLGDYGSPIWNAVGRAVGALASEPSRRAILLLSDGQDTGNGPRVNDPDFRPAVLPSVPNPCQWSPARQNLSVGDVRRATERESVMVYAVSADSPGPSQGLGLNSLADVTFDSGGALFRLGNFAELREAFARIAEELHVQYTLGFVQTEFDGKSHNIRVSVHRPSVRVRARQSFIAAKRAD